MSDQSLTTVYADKEVLNGQNGIATSIDEKSAVDIATKYLQDVLGCQYSACQPVHISSGWESLIHYTPSSGQSIVVGVIKVDEQTNTVQPLSADKIQETQERVAVHLAKSRGKLALDDNGYILPYLAKIRVNGYLTEHVTMFANASGQPELLGNNPSVWRVPVALHLRGHGNVGQLGTIDVNALTGEVISLPAAHIKEMQKRAKDATLRATRSPAATS